MLYIPTSRRCDSNIRYSVTMCLIVREMKRMAHIERRGGSSIFIKYWCFIEVCPIRIRLMEVSVFLVMSGGERHKLFQ